MIQVNVLPNNPNDLLVEGAMVEIQRALLPSYPNFQIYRRIIKKNSIEGYEEVFEAIGYSDSDAKTLTNLLFMSGNNESIFYWLTNNNFKRIVALQAENR